MKTKPTSIIQHKWTFKSRFRKQAFGWRSNPAITRIKEAISEIKKVARKNPILGADGAVLFLEKLSPAIENIDSSSGAIGVATYHAVEALVPIIASAPAENKTRDKWLTRLWVAIEKDEIPYIESITPHWGDLCVTPQCASRWANDFIVITRDVLSAQNNGLYFKGTTICLSSLLKAKRYEEILSLVNNCPYVFWHYRVWGVKSLAAMGKINEAIEYAHNSIGLNDSYYCMAVLCEKILLDNHRFEEAYEKYAYKSNQKGTYLATFRTINSRRRINQCNRHSPQWHVLPTSGFEPITDLCQRATLPAKQPSTIVSINMNLYAIECFCYSDNLMAFDI